MNRTSRKMPIPRFSQRFHRVLNMNGGLKLPGEDRTRLALGISGLALGFSAGVSRQSWGLEPGFSRGHAGINQVSVYGRAGGLRQELGLAGTVTSLSSVAISKCNGHEA